MGRVAKLLVCGMGLVAATPSLGGPAARRAATPVLDLGGDVLAIGGTSRGTVVVLDAVRPDGTAATAVRRREIGLDGGTTSDETTTLPDGFRWTHGAAIDGDGTAALLGTVALAGAQALFLDADGTLSTPIPLAHEPGASLLRDGFLHLLESVSASPFRNSFVWERVRADGTRVGPSALLEPSDSVKALVDDQSPDAAEPRRLDPEVTSLDARADGSAVVVVRTRLPIDPLFWNNHTVTEAEWMYAIDEDSGVHPVPEPDPTPIGRRTAEYSDSARAHAGPVGTTWNVTDFGGLQGDFTAVASNGSAESADAWSVAPARATISGRSSSGTTTDGSLIVPAPGSDRRRGGRLFWASFRADADGRVRSRTRVLADAARAGRNSPGAAAVAPGGASLFASAAGERIFATLVDRRGRAARRLDVPAPDCRSEFEAPLVVACGDLGFAVAWRGRAGDVPASSSDPFRLALVARR